MPDQRRMFGWCMTGHHDTCRTAYTDSNGFPQVCGCTCHGASVDTSVTASEEGVEEVPAVKPKTIKRKKVK